MGSDTSERMMALLQELALLKELEKEYEASPDEGHRVADRERQRRHEEITAEIKALAKQTEEAEPSPSV